MNINLTFGACVAALSIACNEPATSKLKVDPPTWNEQGKAYGAVIACFTSEDQRAVASRDIEQSSRLGSASTWQDMIVSAQSLAVYEYLLPTGLPPRVRELAELSGDVELDVTNTIVRSEKAAGFSPELQVVLTHFPLKRWSAARGVRSLVEEINVSVRLPTNCLAVNSIVANEFGVVYDERVFAQLATADKVAVILEQLFSQITQRRNVSQVALRTLVGNMLGKQGLEEMGTAALTPLTAQFQLSTHRMMVDGKDVWVCGQSVDPYQENLIRDQVVLAQPSEFSIDGWSYSFRHAPGCISWDSYALKGRNNVFQEMRVNRAVRGEIELSGDMTLIREQDGWKHKYGRYKITTKSENHEWLGTPAFDGEELVGFNFDGMEVFQSPILEKISDLQIAHGARVIFYAGTAQIKEVSRVVGTVKFNGVWHQSPDRQGQTFGLKLNENGNISDLIP